MGEQLAVEPDSPEELEAVASARASVSLPGVRRYALAVGAAGLVAATAALVILGAAGGTPMWVVWLPALAAGFWLAERAALEVEYRKGTIAVSLTEFPAVIALLFVDLPVALGASLLATVVREVLRRQHRVVATYNLGVAALDIAVLYVVFELAVESVLPDSVGLLLALAGANVVSTVVAMRLAAHIGEAPSRLARASLVRPLLLMAVVMPVLAVAAVELLTAGPQGWLLLLVVSGAFAALYRSYAVLLRERKDIDLVQRISSTESDSEEIWLEVADLIRQQFNARRAVVRQPGGGALVVAGESLDAETAESVVAHWALAPLPVGECLHWRRGHPEDEPLLTTRGAREALVVALGSGAGAGVLELHDRQNQARGFGAGDIRLAETLARHLSTAADNRRLLAELRDDAYRDRLSGLRNRLGLTERAEVVLAAPSPAPGGQMRCAVLLADLDVLDQVNDALGHDWGDRLVVTVAQRVRTAVHEIAGVDVPLGRLGGDTFGVVLPGVDQARAETIARRLAEVLGAPYPMENLSVEASPAIGVAVSDVEANIPAHGWRRPSMDQLLQQADVAMRSARAAGQAVRSYHDSMGQVFLRRFQLVTQFRSALAAGQVQMYYQPKVTMADRTVVGAEALMRWQHPEFGAVDPEELVRVLEATGLMDELTDFVLDSALQRCRRLLDRGDSVPPAVNVSVRNLLSPTFATDVAAALARHEIPPPMLTLEITETSVMGDAERALPALRTLHEMGVTLSVDDFGTGYSSLSYLRRLPVDEIKIDKSFVLRMGTDLSDLAVVRSIIDLGRSLGLRVVAEGVETDTARDQLAEMGCDVIQGYLISRALPPERFDAWLHAHQGGAREPGGDRQRLH